MSLLVLCPSRGRPEKAAEAYGSFVATKTLPETSLVFIVDENDPSDYEGVPHYTVPATGYMNGALQAAVDRLLKDPHPEYLGFIGDDHRFRTPGWDKRITEVLGHLGGGFAYANDLYQGQNLPTQVFVDTRFVEALGWFGLRGCKHLFIDNAWRDLGDAAGCLYYFPDLVIEHMHPYAGKGEMDTAYERVNSGEMIDHDRAVYEEWRRTSLAADTETIRRLIR